MTRTPASIRNNNPGAMYPGASAKRFGSTSYETLRSKDGVHKIARFVDPVQGAAAQFDLLLTKYTGQTVEKAITRWCGAYYVSTYTKVLQERAGIRPTDMLTKEFMANPDKAIPLAKAMAWQEAGREFPLTDEQWGLAHASALQSVAPSFSPDNDVPSPRPETRTAEALKKWGPMALLGVSGAGGGAVTLPAPPTEAITNLAAWKASTETVASIGAFISAKPFSVALACGLVAGVFFLTKKD